MSNLSDRYSDITSSKERDPKKKSYEIASEIGEPLKAYFKLRRAVGWLGILLPILLVGISIINNNSCEILPSISDYYHTSVGVIFTGVLFAIACFLFYNGEDKYEKLLCRIAAIVAILIAVSPTPLHASYHLIEGVAASISSHHDCYIPKFPDSPLIGQIHFTSATIFFLILTYLAFFKFRKRSIEKNEPTINQIIYLISSLGMFLPMIAIAVYYFFFSKPVIDPKDSSSLIFVCEVIMLWSFGVAWLTKGDFKFESIKDYIKK